jgi:hypothetical protein
MGAPVGTNSVWLALLACVACGGADYGDVPSGSGSQVEWTVVLVRPQETILAVVDDTAQAAPLRDALGAAFDGLDAARDTQPGTCGAVFDPAAWHPVDRSVVIVHPSSEGSARFSSPADAAALRWSERDQTADGHASWITAVRAALAAAPAEAGARFQALAAFQDSVALVSGQRQPVTADEQALLAALPGGNSSSIVSVALATEDQSPGAASQYTSAVPDDLVVPAATPGTATTCQRPLESPTPRYAGWVPSPQLWPCADPHFFDVGSLECGPAGARCLARPITISDSGAAVCLVTATYAGSEPCPAELGWLDPMGSNGVRAPQVEHGAAGDTRTCEVQQLDGAALTSCRSSLDCADCVPGWCATDLLQLIPDQFCPSGNQLAPLRFVGGADSGPQSASNVTLNVVCDEDPLP